MPPRHAGGLPPSTSPPAGERAGSVPYPAHGRRGEAAQGAGGRQNLAPAEEKTVPRRSGRLFPAKRRRAGRRGKAEGAEMLPEKERHRRYLPGRRDGGGEASADFRAFAGLARPGRAAAWGRGRLRPGAGPEETARRKPLCRRPAPGRVVMPRSRALGQWGAGPFSAGRVRRFRRFFCGAGREPRILKRWRGRQSGPARPRGRRRPCPESRR